MEIIIKFDEDHLVEICGSTAIEKYRRAMNRYQLDNNPDTPVILIEREAKLRKKICEKLLKHIKKCNVFNEAKLEDIEIYEDCYINPFKDSVTEFVRFKATLYI